MVAFEEGDPDQPLIVGSVYNAANMPPFALPAARSICGIRSASVSGNAGQNFNGVVFNDTLGKEHLALHSEHNMSLNAEKDKMFHGGRNKGERVAHASLLTVGSLPTGGGSGGGTSSSSSSISSTGGGDSSSSSSDQPEGYAAFGTLPWTVAPAQPGLSAATVYGNNVAATIGEAYTLAFGGVSQLTVDPSALLSTSNVPYLQSIIGGFFGGAVGGNSAFNLGSNTGFVLGPQFQITITPKGTQAERDKTGKITNPEEVTIGGENTIDVKATALEVPVIDILAIVLSLLSVAWIVSYAAFQATDDDSDRVAVVESCQALALVLQGAIVSSATLSDYVKKQIDEAWKKKSLAYQQNLVFFLGGDFMNV